MKTALKLLVVLLAVGSSSFADGGIARSSFTLTNDTTVNISSASEVVAVIVSSATTAGTLKLYDSRGAASGQIANIGLGNVMDYEFDLHLSSGLTYSTTLNGGGVTIIYRKY